MQREAIKDLYRVIIGWIETDSSTGDQVAKDFNGIILGRYNAKLDVTTDFYGRILYRGNMVASLIYENNAKKKQNMR